MIKLNVIQAPELIYLGEVNINLPNITIGRLLKNTIAINDPSFGNQKISLSLSKKGLYATSESFFKINGKRIKGNIKVKEKDTISLGNTTIEIISYNTEHLPDEDQYYKNLEAMSIEHAESYNIVEALEQEYAIELGKLDELEN